MIQIAPGTKVYLACRPVSMRYGFDGLAAQVANVLAADPFLCVGRDSVAAASREAHLHGSGSACRHIICKHPRRPTSADWDGSAISFWDRTQEGQFLNL